MADKQWSLESFADGYSSGIISQNLPSPDSELETVQQEEQKLGGSLSEFFYQVVKPRISPNDYILELGPGRGSWTRALIHEIPQGELHTIDLQDVSQWLNDVIDAYPQRLFINTVNKNELTYDCLKNDFFDMFFSFGVFCHMNIEDIVHFLITIRKKLKKNAVCIAQYSDWPKAVRYCQTPDGYASNKEAYDELCRMYAYEIEMLQRTSLSGKLSLLYQKYVQHQFPKPEIAPEHCFWVKNDQEQMKKILKESGYKVLNIDMGYFQRDSVALFQPIS
ncbi:MAG: class I SAM-dependent methyltransferase [Desulfobacterales bacterium]|nr:class I SAM-dependent methyltransferase [Desulfobacterales bacterium]